jgi:arginine-tRNA-protein transferase
MAPPPEIVVYDAEEDCAYLPGRRARLPLRQPVRRLTPQEFDRRLEAGDRRAGWFLYNQACRDCDACEALRVDVANFEPSRSQRRVQAKATARIVARVGPMEVDEPRVALYRAHLDQRDLGRGQAPMDAGAYEAFLVASCTDGFEIRYTVDDKLIGVAITDRGARALSAVYTTWDPAYAALSPGTFSILTQIALARRERLDWVYLGLAVRGSRPMAYKTTFMPHERRIQGVWHRFERE